MGTTSTALRSGSGKFCYVLVIEGFEYLLHDHTDSDAIVAAYAATDWAAALPGLKVGGPFSQRIQPWADGFDVPTLQVSVQPDADDIFGKAVFKTKPAYASRLASTFQPAADGSGTITVKSTAGAAANGDIYIGGQRHTYTSAGANTFTVGAAGSNALAPFSANGSNKYARPSLVAPNVNYDVGVAPTVQDVPHQWIGRHVALRIHRISGDTVDSYAQSQLEFAGRIQGFSDSENGDTVLELEDLRGAVRDAVILDRQWVGYVKPGVRLLAGTRFKAAEHTNDAGSAYSGELTVVASGASGVDEIDAGIYEIGELQSKLDAWLAADATILGKWSFAVRNVADAGKRFQIDARFSSGQTRRIWLLCTSADVFQFLGFGDGGAAGNLGDGTTEGTYGRFTEDETHWYKVAGNGNDTLYSVIVSAQPPYKTKFIQNKTFGTLSAVQVELETASEGTFFNQRTYLPPALRPFTGSTGSWGVFQVGSAIYLGRLDDATHISGLSQGIATLKYVDESDDPLGVGLRVDAEEDKLEVRQILLLEGAFADIFTKLVASTSGNGVNHADYDVFPWGAGIPWSLLGDTWVNSAKALEQALNSKAITTLVTAPTRLLDLMTPELALRFAWMVWKNEGYQLRTLPTPSSIAADHALDETNKAEPGDTMSAGRTTTAVTTEYLRNVIKLRYARDAKGEYRRTVTIVDSPSVSTNGGSRALTIEAINSFGQEAAAGASVEEMIASLTARVLPVFARPLKTMRRSIAPTLYHAVPGDTVTVTDDFARDPTTGARGITARAGVLLSTSFDRGAHGGKLFGEVEILFTDEDRHFPMAPVAEVDTSYSGTVGGYTFANGYSVAGALKLKTHAYSRSTDAVDASRFSASDKVRVVRMDGAVSGDAWSRTVSSVDSTNSILVLTATLSSPSFTAASTEIYRVQFDRYSTCQASQKLFAFQADDGDGMIEDVAQPNTYGEQDWTTAAVAAATAPPNLPVPAEFWGDGKAMHAGILYDAALFHNNLPNYRTAPNAPLLLRSPAAVGQPIYTPILCVPFYLGAPATAGLVRKLYVAPFLKATVGSTATVRVTTSANPPVPDKVNAVLAFDASATSVTFTTTSTSYAQATAQSLAPARSGSITWVTVEMKTSVALSDAYCYGLSRCNLGPAEVF